MFGTSAIHTGSKKHVDSIFVHVQILKYPLHKLGIAEYCILDYSCKLMHRITLMYHIVKKVSYKVTELVFDEKHHMYS